MELFESLERHFAFVIVREKLTAPSNANVLLRLKVFLLNLRHLRSHFWLTYGIMITLLFIMFEVSTFQGYSNSVYALLTMTLNEFYVITISRNRQALFQTIDNLRNTIETRTKLQSKTIYSKAIAFVNNFTKILYFILMKIAFPLITFPYLMTSYHRYLTTDLGPDAFQLPFHTW